MGPTVVTENTRTRSARSIPLSRDRTFVSPPADTQPLPKTIIVDTRPWLGSGFTVIGVWLGDFKLELRLVKVKFIRVR